MPHAAPPVRRQWVAAGLPPTVVTGTYGTALPASPRHCCHWQQRRAAAMLCTRQKSKGHVQGKQAGTTAIHAAWTAPACRPAGSTARDAAAEGDTAAGRHVRTLGVETQSLDVADEASARGGGGGCKTQDRGRVLEVGASSGWWCSPSCTGGSRCCFLAASNGAIYTRRAQLNTAAC